MRRLIVTLTGGLVRLPCCRACRRPLARVGRRVRFYRTRHLLDWVADRTAADFARGRADALQDALDRHAWYGDESAGGHEYVTRIDVWCCRRCGVGHTRFRVDARTAGGWTREVALTADAADGAGLAVRDLAAG